MIWNTNAVNAAWCCHSLTAHSDPVPPAAAAPAWVAYTPQIFLRQLRAGQSIWHWGTMTRCFQPLGHRWCEGPLHLSKMPSFNGCVLSFVGFNSHATVDARRQCRVNGQLLHSATPIYGSLYSLALRAKCNTRKLLYNSPRAPLQLLWSPLQSPPLCK